MATAIVRACGRAPWSVVGAVVATPWHPVQAACAAPLGMCAMPFAATKRTGGASRNGRDSPGQRLGVKKFGGERVKAGNIIIRQRGTRVAADANVRCATQGWKRCFRVVDHVGEERMVRYSCC